MPRAGQNPDQELLDELRETQEELARANSKLDRITGVSTAFDESATDEQLKSALDSIYELAAPDDERDFEFDEYGENAPDEEE